VKFKFEEYTNKLLKKLILDEGFKKREKNTFLKVNEFGEREEKILKLMERKKNNYML
jgi:hypothetical protein